jgi:hypothetical protein
LSWGKEHFKTEDTPPSSWTVERVEGFVRALEQDPFLSPHLIEEAKKWQSSFDHVAQIGTWGKSHFSK